MSNFWTFVISVAILVTAIASVVIAVRVGRILVVLEQLNTAFDRLRKNLTGISTVIHSQQEAIQTRRQKEEENAEQLLRGDERISLTSGKSQ